MLRQGRPNSELQALNLRRHGPFQFGVCIALRREFIDRPVLLESGFASTFELGRSKSTLSPIFMPVVTSLFVRVSH